MRLYPFVQHYAGCGHPVLFQVLCRRSVDLADQRGIHERLVCSVHEFPIGGQHGGVILAASVAQWAGKKHTLIYSGLLIAVLSVGFFFIPLSQAMLIFGINLLIGVAGGIVFPLIWAMYADVADYSEWRSGRRATGLIFSSSLMSQKIGWTASGAVSGWILGWFGFEASLAWISNWPVEVTVKV